MGVPAIETEDLTKRFGDVVAVDRLTLRLEPGEILGFLGPNGAGKTTTIRLLLDLIRPSAGRATVLGMDPSDHTLRARIGYLPAELAFDPRWVVADVLDHVTALRRGTSNEVDPLEVARLSERFGVQPDRRIGEMSTGNRRKVGIVVAFAHHPELLILDEPTSGLDPLLQHEFHTLVAERVAEGASVFLSSHVLPEVERMADRVAVIRSGRLADVVPVDEVGGRAQEHLVFTFADAEVTSSAFYGLPGVVGVEAAGREVTVTMNGPVHPVLARAAELRAERVDVRHLELEDLFMDLYRGDGA